MPTTGAVSYIDYVFCDDTATKIPSSSPTNKPSDSPATSMTPTTGCNYVECDFSTLQPGMFLSETEQMNQLLNDCGISVNAVEGKSLRNVNVFDSFNIRSKRGGGGQAGDTDLGSPNNKCRGGGPGIGRGGTPDSRFPNCDAQGNLLIIQDPREPNQMIPNDSGYGGCLTLSFASGGVQLVNMGLLDVEEPVTITVSVS